MCPHVTVILIRGERFKLNVVGIFSFSPRERRVVSRHLVILILIGGLCRSLDFVDSYHCPIPMTVGGVQAPARIATHTVIWAPDCSIANAGA